MRRGRAQPCRLTACQIIYNVLLTQRYKKKAKLKQCFKNLMPSRKAQGVRFTLPLAPFLTAMRNSVCRKMQHSHTKALLFSECCVLPAPQRSSARAAVFLFQYPENGFFDKKKPSKNVETLCEDKYAHASTLDAKWTPASTKHRTKIESKRAVENHTQHNAKIIEI